MNVMSGVDIFHGVSSERNISLLHGNKKASRMDAFMID